MDRPGFSPGSHALGEGGPEICSRRTRPVSFQEEHGTLGEDADLVAHRAPGGGGILQVNPVRFQHDQIDPGLPGIAHNLRGAVAEHDFLPSGHPVRFKRMAEPCEVVAGHLFEAGVKFPVFRRPQLTDHLDDVQECDLSAVLLRETCGDLKRWLVHVGQIDRHEDVLKHGPILLLWTRLGEGRRARRLAARA
jgi:hypothetical protein